MATARLLYTQTGGDVGLLGVSFERERGGSRARRKLEPSHAEAALRAAMMAAPQRLVAAALLLHAGLAAFSDQGSLGQCGSGNFLLPDGAYKKMVLSADVEYDAALIYNNGQNTCVQLLVMPVSRAAGAEGLFFVVSPCCSTLREDRVGMPTLQT